MFNGKYGKKQDFLFNKMKTGRPPLSQSQKKGQFTGLRLRDEERDLLEKAAQKGGKKLSEWMRLVLVKSANLELTCQDSATP